MLLIEKVIFSSQSIIPLVSGEPGHGHSHGGEELPHDHAHQENLENQDDEEEEAIKNVVSAKGKFASFLGLRNCKYLII
jgi:hypothetical protein